MDSFAKCGNGYGYGYYDGYGYGNSKPQMNYHRQNTESVTTVVTEMNRMTVNDKPCGGGDVQKQAFKVDAFQEHDQAAYNSAVAVQKHSLKEEKEEKYGAAAAAAAAVKKHDEYKNEEKYGAHYGGGATVKKQGYGYKQEEAYGETEAAAGYGGGVKKLAGYNYTQEACGGSDTGYGAAVQTYAYDQQAAPYGGGAIGAAEGYKHKDGASKANGSQQKVYGYGYGEAAVDAAGAAGYVYGGGAVQQHGHQKDAYGYAAAAGGGKVKKSGHQYHDAYGGTDAGGYGGGAVQQHGYQKDAYGYGAAVGGKVKNNGYQYQETYGGTGAGGGDGAHYGGDAAAVQRHGHGCVYQSETQSDESDCDEAFPPRGGRMQQGGVQHSYGAYNKQEEKHGAGNLGGVRRYASYQTSVQYTGGGGGGGGYATCSPIKNRRLLRYGA